MELVILPDDIKVEFARVKGRRNPGEVKRRPTRLVDRGEFSDRRDELDLTLLVLVLL